MCFFLLFFLQIASASPLEVLSGKVNKNLPEVYDHATKLVRTTVENGSFVYHFIVRANSEEYAFAMPKVRAQIMGTICQHQREGMILGKYGANVVYRYENEKGQSLGEFMVPSGYCK